MKPNSRWLAHSALLVCLLSHAAVGSPKADARSACATLKQLNSPDFTVTESVLVAPGDVGPGTEVYERPNHYEEHCLVRGAFGQRTGVAGRIYQIRFELRMPTVWNGRFLFEGGAYMDGVDWPARGSLFGTLSPTALQRGFAVVRTNSGHTSPHDNAMDGTFAIDQQARIDYAFNSLDKVTLRAKEIVRAYYGRAAAHSYFIGCSNGGRQGMLAAQRFPTYFDGIVAGNPPLNISPLSARLVWNMRVLSRIAPRDADGRPIISKAFSDAQLNLITAAAVKQCDALDGLRDGAINDIRDCHFDPATVLCRKDAPSNCLTPPQVDALHQVMEGPLDSTGRPLFGQFTYDGGFAQSFRAMYLGRSNTAKPDAAAVAIGLGTLRWYSLTPPDPTFDPDSFDLQEVLARTRQTAAMNDSDWTFMNTFASHGKMILYAGVADYAEAVYELANWYDRLASDTGGNTQDWTRLFFVPNMKHCGGGDSTDDFDTLQAIQDWVENGKAPDRIVATGKKLPGVSRPLCPWPKAARFVGGDENKDTSFACK